MANLFLPSIPDSPMFINRPEDRLTTEWQNFFENLYQRIGYENTNNLDDVEVSALIGLFNSFSSGKGLIVKGPFTSTDNALARFDGITGKLLQNSTAILDDDGNLSIQAKELTVGSINRETGVLTVEIGGIAILSLQSGSLTVGSGEAGIDYSLLFNGETYDGTITWKEDENCFYFDKDTALGTPSTSQTVNGVAITTRFLASVDQIPTKVCAAFADRGNVAAKGALVYFARSRESSGHAIVQDGDMLGHMLFLGWDGTDFAQAACIEVTIDGTPGSNDMPGKISLKTSPDGSQTPVTHIDILEDGTVLIGDIAGGNTTEIEPDGTITFNGNATTFRDEYTQLIGARLESPSSHITQNDAEGSLTFNDSCTLSDYVVMSPQINHDWKSDSAIEVHLHWWQTSSDVPNWLLQYRYQTNGQAKTTAWTSLEYDSHAFTYVSGTLNQITTFGNITLPGTTSISDILQIRLLRDTNNDSGLFAGTDPLTGDVDAVSYDAHIETDTVNGSRQRYVK